MPNVTGIFGISVEAVAFKVYTHLFTLILIDTLNITCLYQFIICVYYFHDVTMDLDAILLNHVRKFSPEGLNFRQSSFVQLTKFMTLCAETQKLTGRMSKNYVKIKMAL